jgi:hypothetical protein
MAPAWVGVVSATNGVPSGITVPVPTSPAPLGPFDLPTWTRGTPRRFRASLAYGALAPAIRWTGMGEQHRASGAGGRGPGFGRLVLCLLERGPEFLDESQNDGDHDDGRRRKPCRERSDQDRKPYRRAQ